jgi:hypothetical protein
MIYWKFKKEGPLTMWPYRMTVYNSICFTSFVLSKIEVEDFLQQVILNGEKDSIVTLNHVKDVLDEYYKIQASDD